PDNYKIIVVTDSRGFVADASRDNNSQASATDFALDIPELADGIPVNGMISDGQDIYFRITLPAGKTPLVTLSSGAVGGAELYSMLGNVPTRGLFDHSAFNPSNNLVKITHDPGASGTYYILIH